MRISDKHIHQVLRAYSDQVRRQEKRPISSSIDKSSGHEIKLSPESQEFLAALQTLRNLPEVDTERVAQLRQQIEAGTYQVDCNSIARRMLAEHRLDRLI